MEVIERIVNFVKRSESGVSIALTGNDPWGLFDTARSIPERVEGFPPKPSDLMAIDTKGEDIGIDLIREISNFLSFSPEFSDRKYVIVKDVNLMTQQASNAFLKTLEEPPRYGVIIITTAMWYYLLPTIRSRLVRFEIPSSPKDLKDPWLRKCSEVDSRVSSDVDVKFKNVSDALKAVLKLDEQPEKGYKALEYILETLWNSPRGDLIVVLDSISSQLSGKDFFRFLKLLSRSILLWLDLKGFHDISTVRFFDSISRSKIANFNNILTLYNVAIRLREMKERGAQGHGIWG